MTSQVSPLTNNLGLFSVGCGILDPLKTNLSTKLMTVGYQATEIEWVDTREPHDGHGETHCTTNSKREAP
jgi:hypothetical protein